MKKNRTSRGGQTLVEAVVVIGVVVLLVTGLLAGTTVSLRSAESGRTRTQAISLAQQGVEIIRGLRDEHWDSFAVLTGIYCLGDDHQLNAAVGSCVPNIITPEGTLTRSALFDWQDPKMVVHVVVSYRAGDTTRDITLTTYFTQWK